MDHRPSTIDQKVFRQSLGGYEQNAFAGWLVSLFGEEIAGTLISKYLVGTSKHWPGATVFWQVDENGAIRTGKVMLYGHDGKRVKKPFNHITWAHVLLGGSGQFPVGSMQLERDNEPSKKTANSQLPTGNFQQCLFGAHLLREEPLKPVAVVESEKSAIIASVYLPQFVWLAAGSLSNLGAGKCAVLKGRNVTLFPDLNAFEKWQLKAAELGMGFKVSALLEQAATETERSQGLDIADYLLRFNPNDFGLISREENAIRKAESRNQEKPEPYYSFDDRHAILSLFAGSFGCGHDELWHMLNIPVIWPDNQKEIDRIAAYFNNTDLPEGPVRLNAYSVIHNLRRYVNTNLDTASYYPANDRYLPYLRRLQEVEAWLKKGGKL